MKARLSIAQAVSRAKCNCSLNEAWIEMLDRCVIDIRLSEVILPLMHNCFFCGATQAVFLLDNGHGAQLAADIAAFFRE
jgi:hypothetical protein